jgi:hypothetical protein
MLELVLTAFDPQAFACDSVYSCLVLRDSLPNLQSLTNSIGTLGNIRRIMREFSTLHPSMTSQKRSSREGDVNGERIDMIECMPLLYLLPAHRSVSAKHGPLIDRLWRQWSSPGWNVHFSFTAIAVFRRI